MSRGLFEALHAAAARPVTVAYPHEREAPTATMRGSVGFLAERCTACRRCVAACPVACIEVEGEERPVPPAELRAMWLDRGACVACGACVEVCPTGALVWTAVDELARVERVGLVAGPDELRPLAGSDGLRPPAGPDELRPPAQAPVAADGDAL